MYYITVIIFWSFLWILLSHRTYSQQFRRISFSCCSWKKHLFVSVLLTVCIPNTWILKLAKKDQKFPSFSFLIKILILHIPLILAKQLSRSTQEDLRRSFYIENILVTVLCGFESINVSKKFLKKTTAQK